MAAKHKYDFGIIGNCSYMAHIDQRANVAWLCWPRFDSSFVFGGLLDDERGGHFFVEPRAADFSTRQFYLENTNVLCTEFEAPDGRFRVTDFAPRFAQYDRYYKPLMLFRKIEPIEGNPKIRVCCEPRGEWGKLRPEPQLGSNHIRYSGYAEQLRLTSSIPLTYVMDKREFILNQTQYLALTWGIPLEAPLMSTGEEFLRKTDQYWKKWILSASIGNFHQGAVIRSALALKLHQFDDTGAIIAAGTTSLPESPGKGRNWDYRYCWLRDAYYTLTAFNSIGHFEELDTYANYIMNIAISEQGRYRPVYAIDGIGDLTERQIELQGYQGNTPVRVGNQAHAHIQNDVYGQILVSLLPLYVDKRFPHMGRVTSVELINRLLLGIESTMDEGDAGLWEFRQRSQKHCYTFLFHWAGSSAAEKIAKRLGDAAMEKHARRLKSESAKRIEQCYDKARGVYTQATDSKNLDASAIQLITMRYLDPASDRAQSHLAAVAEELSVGEGGLFYRYTHEDDFGKPQTAFLICAYWYVEALACLGRVEEAVAAFEKLSTYSNHLGLLSEDVDPKDGSQWGNFPQAYSHVGLVNAAHRIGVKLDRPHFV